MTSRASPSGELGRPDCNPPFSSGPSGAAPSPGCEAGVPRRPCAGPPTARDVGRSPLRRRTCRRTTCPRQVAEREAASHGRAAGGRRIVPPAQLARLAPFADHGPGPPPSCILLHAGRGAIDLGTPIPSRAGDRGASKKVGQDPGKTASRPAEVNRRPLLANTPPEIRGGGRGRRALARPPTNRRGQGQGASCMYWHR